MGCPVKLHPICVGVGIFLCSYWVLGHWHECTWPPLCSWWPLYLPIHYCEALRAYWVSCRMAMVVYRGWALRCSLNLSPNDLPDSVMYSCGQLMSGHLDLYLTLLFGSLLHLSLGAMRRVLMLLLPLKCTQIPNLLHVLFNLSSSLCMYGTTMEIFLMFHSLLLMLLG